MIWFYGEIYKLFHLPDVTSIDTKNFMLVVLRVKKFLHVYGGIFFKTCQRLSPFRP
jgi:hypothetical protein